MGKNIIVEYTHTKEYIERKSNVCSKNELGTNIFKNELSLHYFISGFTYTVY